MNFYGHSGTGDKNCLATAQDVLFGHQLLGATGTPPPKTREYIKKMIAIMECDTPISKDRWLGHPCIPPRMSGPRQYLVTPPIQRTKPKVTLKPHRRVKLIGGSDAKGSVKAEFGPINHFVCWFQTISANLNVEAQKSASSASQEAASSVLANEWYDKGKSDAVKVAPVRGDLRRVEYSAKMAEIGFPSRGQD